MATFLTTRRMHPALAERVEASVRGRRARRRMPRAASIVRLALIVLVVVAVSSFVAFRRRETASLERERGALVESLHAQGASLGADDKASLSRAETWLIKLAGSYEGDLVPEDLQLADLLARPAVYVRGPLAAFASPAPIAAAAAVSVKDAFLLCLVAPPASRAERVVLAKVRTAYAGADLPTSNVRRLHEEEVGLRLLAPSWEERVRGARDAREIAGLRAELERAPLERAKQAARARLLIVAMDEPADRPQPADLDGERAHPVRVALVDLGKESVLLRLRRRVDPSAWSTAARAEYSSGLDGCALAIDVHDVLSR